MNQHLSSNHEANLFRSPTLETVKMVESTINKYSGEFKKTQIWQRLPRKVMWPTYLIILDYLEEMNQIIISDDGIITYIWDPELAKKLCHKKSYEYVIDQYARNQKDLKTNNTLLIHGNK